jgi:ABC-type phosphate transport system substrate-binding protein
MMNSKFLRFCSATILALGLAQIALAGDVVVISNPELAISAGDIKDIFLGEKQFAGTTKLVVIDNASAQGAFLGKYMQMDATKYNNIWTKKSFRDGLTPPAVKSGDAEVTEFVKKTPGAIGYVSSSPSGVNLIQKP